MVPSVLPRRICTGYFTVSAHMPLKTLWMGLIDNHRLGAVQRAAQHLRRGEHADQHRQEPDPAEKVGIAAGKKRGKAAGFHADRGDQEPRHQHDRAFQRPV